MDKISSTKKSASQPHRRNFHSMTKRAGTPEKSTQKTCSAPGGRGTVYAAPRGLLGRGAAVASVTVTQCVTALTARPASAGGSPPSKLSALAPPDSYVCTYVYVAMEDGTRTHGLAAWL